MSHRMPALAAAAIACVALPATAADLAGRWEGEARIPEAPLRIVVDIARSAMPTAPWVGSVVLPGFGVKGAPLRELAVGETSVRASLDSAFSGPRPAGARVDLALAADGTLQGRYHQGGHSAPLRLVRSGPAQVDAPPPATAIAPALEGTWLGRYELGGYPREVTLTLANRGSGTAGGQLLIVGRRRSELAVERVVQGRQFITIEAPSAAIRIEGRWRDGEIDGEFTQGPFEARLVLRRSATPAAAASSGGRS